MTTTTWRPWHIDNGRIVLGEWDTPRRLQAEYLRNSRIIEAGVVRRPDVLIACDTFAPCNPSLLADLQHDLFALIDSCPDVHFLLPTLHPELVREAWLSHDTVSSAGSGLEHQDRTNHYPNVILVAGPLRTQADADRLIPATLALRDLCGGVWAWCKPEEAMELSPLLKEVMCSVEV